MLTTIKLPWHHTLQVQTKKMEWQGVWRSRQKFCKLSSYQFTPFKVFPTKREVWPVPPQYCPHGISHPTTTIRPRELTARIPPRCCRGSWDPNWAFPKAGSSQLGEGSSRGPTVLPQWPVHEVWALICPSAQKEAQQSLVGRGFPLCWESLHFCPSRNDLFNFTCSPIIRQSIKGLNALMCANCCFTSLVGCIL